MQIFEMYSYYKKYLLELSHVARSWCNVIESFTVVQYIIMYAIILNKYFQKIWDKIWRNCTMNKWHCKHCHKVLQNLSDLCWVNVYVSKSLTNGTKTPRVKDHFNCTTITFVKFNIYSWINIYLNIRFLFNYLIIIVSLVFIDSIIQGVIHSFSLCLFRWNFTL